MKKLSLIGMGLVLLMAMTQCKKAETPTANEMEGEKVHITLDVDNGEKNFVHPETGNTFFTNGDEVLVANNGHYVGTLTYSSSNRHFSGDITGAVETDYLHFYFMGNQDLVEGTPSSSTETFTVNISNQTNCYPQIAYNHSTAYYSQEVTSYKATLLNQCALVEFTTNEIHESTVVTLRGLNNTVSVNLDSKEFTFSQTDGGKIIPHTESTTSRWAILLPQSDMSGVTVDAIAGFDAESVTFNVPAINNNDYLPAGANCTLTAIPLTFKARANNVTVSIRSFNNSSLNLLYSQNGGEWTSFTGSVTLNENETVSFRGDNTVFSNNGRRFELTGPCYIYGNVMSLLHATDYAINREIQEEAFAYLFYSTGYIDIDPDKDLVLPAMELTSRCYDCMFRNCTGLTRAPELPATKLAKYCYYHMFDGCSQLIEAPELPATRLFDYCYEYMFSGCTNLTTAPTVLPATTMTTSCYHNMFYNCSSLETAPVLPATTLYGGCYQSMFSGCTHLSNITCLATEGINPNGNTRNWMSNAGSSVEGTKTFTRNPNVPVGSGTSGQYWPWGANGIPDGWTVNPPVE